MGRETTTDFGSDDVPDPLLSPTSVSRTGPTKDEKDVYTDCRVRPSPLHPPLPWGNLRMEWKSSTAKGWILPLRVFLGTKHSFFDRSQGNGGVPAGRLGEECVLPPSRQGFRVTRDPGRHLPRHPDLGTPWSSTLTGS